ncbi:LysR family transcriptional regulator [Paracoccus sp. Z118]|uniref:LysR family transcriptional regulator n=1 Tax=Paracoccus sp. Z118 TaxID=2851017 RepID=UPI001C2BCFC9|nr:LysR family transcriptional regulator [Paracoccus sp. Z118]
MQPRQFRGNLSDTDIAALRDFIEIVEAGGITAAQARLGKGKSAISLTLSRLESRLSMRLCERGRSGFRLTEQGRMVHSAAVQLMNEIGRFSDFVGAATRKLEGEVSMSADDSFLFEFADPLSRAIARINDRYPGLKLNLRMSSPDHILASVLEGSADLGFTALIRPSDALVAAPVCKERMGIFCGKDHPLFPRDDRELTMEELRRHSFVAAEVAQEAAFSDFVGALTVAATAPTILSRMLLILSSRYLGSMPLAFAAPWVERGDVREIAVPGSRGANTCYLIHRRARPLGLGGSIFRSTILDEFEKWGSSAA